MLSKNHMDQPKSLFVWRKLLSRILVKRGTAILDEVRQLLLGARRDMRALTSSLIVLVLTTQITAGPIAGAKTRRAPASRTKAASSRLKAKPATQAGETITIYGPRRFDRVAGPPTSVVEQFS